MRSIGQIFSRMLLSGDLSGVIGFLFCFEKSTEVKCHFHHIILRVHTISMTYTVDVDLDYLAETVKDLSKAFHDLTS